MRMHTHACVGARLHCLLNFLNVSIVFKISKKMFFSPPRWSPDVHTVKRDDHNVMKRNNNTLLSSLYHGQTRYDVNSVRDFRLPSMETNRRRDVSTISKIGIEESKETKKDDLSYSYRSRIHTLMDECGLIMKKDVFTYSPTSSSSSSSDLFSTKECRRILASCLSRLGEEFFEFRDLSILEEACRLIDSSFDDDNVCVSSSSSSSSNDNSSCSDGLSPSLSIGDNLSSITTTTSSPSKITQTLCLRLNQSVLILLEKYASFKCSMKSRKLQCSDVLISSSLSK